MAETKPPVVLAAVQLPDADDVQFEASLKELARLVDTLGFKAIARVVHCARGGFRVAKLDALHLLCAAGAGRVG